MDKIEKVRQEIERRIALYSRLSEYNIDPNRIDEDEQLLSFLDSLEDEPETKDLEQIDPKHLVHSQGYDEAYLNEKIAKASKSWKGVDVDRYMDMVRGGEPVADGLEEAARQYGYTYNADWPGQVPAARDGFVAGAQWKEEQLMKEAVEGEIQMRYSGCLCAKTIRAINEDKFNLGDKVKVIVIKED